MFRAPRLVDNLAYYISNHGYGHYARSIPLLRRLVADFNVHIKSELHESLLTKHLKTNTRCWTQPVDIGCRHSTSFEVDTKETFKCFEEFQNRSMIEAEKTWLQENQISLVISDVASMPIKAAHDVDIPSILIGNFTWHDIYSHLPGAIEHKQLL